MIRVSDWEPVAGGKSTARVHRRDGIIRKIGPGAAAEAARLEWLAQAGIPVPKVIEVADDFLLMTEVSGQTAAAPWPESLRGKVIDGLAGLARTLHGLPVAECPFDRTLGVTVPEAVVAVAAGIVDYGDLDAERAGWDSGQLLAELAATMPDSQDIVVAHGDLCVPNVLFDTETGRLTGVIDVDRLGRADRYVDLAITTRSLSSELNPQYGLWAAERFLIAYGIDRPDLAKMEFYRLLDEFA
jgi:aminoglycoside phosphotransferase